MLINPQLRFKWLWLLVGYGLLALIVYLSLTHTPPKGPDIPFVDKWGHLVAYAALMGWFGQLFHHSRSRLILLVLLIATGISLEYLQQMGGVRMFELEDMVANTLGVIIGWQLSMPQRGGRLLIWIEQRL
jgi:VanZ family protein